MYKLLLTSRYLRRRLIPLLAMAPVMLCTAMVIIVLSVMGGFLDLVKNAGRTVMGDVSIHAGVGGFPHYELILEEVRRLPEAKAATPIIVAYGLIKLPGAYTKPVQVYGIEGEGQAQVTQFRDTLYWKRGTIKTQSTVAELFPENGPDPIDAAMKMQTPWPQALDAQGQLVPAMIAGIEVSPYNIRLNDGSYQFSPPVVGLKTTLSILPISRAANIDTITPETREFVVINEFNSGVYDVDSQRVYIPFELAQKMMRMEPTRKIARNPDGSVKLENGRPVVIGMEPARATEIHIRAADGVSAERLRDAVIAVYDRLAEKHSDLHSRPYVQVQTWKERQARFLAAVENEKGLMSFLFGIISLVAVLVVGLVFYMIVLEKTRDIGILRALGASQPGIASIFLSFGAVVGTLGALLGTAIAYAIVLNINEIHAWLGDGLGQAIWWLGLTQVGVLVGGLIGLGVRAIQRRRAVRRYRAEERPGLATLLTLLLGWVFTALLTLLFIRRRVPKQELVGLVGGGLAGLGGAWAALLASTTLADDLNRRFSVVIWDRSVYFFDTIPSRVNSSEVLVIVGVAIIASIIGALIPSIMAALVDPVESLRYE